MGIEVGMGMGMGMGIEVGMGDGVGDGLLHCVPLRISCIHCRCTSAMALCNNDGMA